MGLFDGLTGKLGALFGGTGASGDLIHGVLSMIDDPQHGGLSGLVQKFEQNGMGDVIQSWIGTGANQMISPDKLASLLGPERLQQISQATGISVESLGAKLATVLPTVIDKLTPTGTMPQGNLLDRAQELLKGKLG